MRPRGLAPATPTDPERAVPRRSRLAGLAAFALVGILAFSVAGRAGAATTEHRIQGCGWNEATPRDHAF
jgi:hypothetical protein